MSRRAFTLIELLVVVAIIALLIAMLLPAMAKAKEETKTTKCQGNLHQLAIAFATYANQNKDLMPALGSSIPMTGLGWLRDWYGNNGPPQLMGWSDSLLLDGCLKQNANWKGTLDMNNSWHYPTVGWGLMSCPSHAAQYQNMQGTYTDSRYARAYSMAWCAHSRWYDNGDGAPWSVLSRNLDSQHIIAMEAGMNAGTQGAYFVPAHMDRTSMPGYAGYGMYERHIRNNTRGANYLFADSHVEWSSDYGWSPSPFSYISNRGAWTVSNYQGPPVLPNGTPNKNRTNRIWAHGASN